ncbi:MAG: DUF4339 domain-containing protein [Planctomycetota bacterium]|nr:DUF4339 domain-containing protein [Planctomycetota bacterium]
MSEQWYLRHQGNEIGPLAEEQLLQMAADGQVAPSAEIRKDGTTRWVTAIRVKGLFPDSTDAPPVAGPPSAPPPLPADNTDATSSGDQSNSLWDDLDLDELNQIPTSVSQPVTSAVQPADSRKPAAAGHSKRWLLIGGAGLSLVVVVVAIVVLAGFGGTDVSQREPDSSNSQVEPPAPSARGVFPTLPAGPQGTNPRQPAVADWRELRPGSGTRLGKLSIVVDHLWVQPSLSPAAADQRDTPETNTKAAPEPGTSESSAERFLFIKFTFRSGDTGFRYSSWNGTGSLGANVSANLTDAEETSLPLIPLDKTPTEARQASVDLDARSVASDVLVFKLPAAVTGEIRLQLPQEALGLTGPPLQFRISPEVLATSRRPQTAPSDTLAGNAVSNPLGDTTAPGGNGEQPGSATDLLRNINRPATATDAPPQPERTRPATCPSPSPQTGPLDKPGKKAAAGKAKQKTPATKQKSKRKSKSPRKPRIENKFNPF